MQLVRGRGNIPARRVLLLRSRAQVVCCPCVPPLHDVLQQGRCVAGLCTCWSCTHASSLVFGRSSNLSVLYHYCSCVGCTTSVWATCGTLHGVGTHAGGAAACKHARGRIACGLRCRGGGARGTYVCARAAGGHSLLGLGEVAPPKRAVFFQEKGYGGFHADNSQCAWQRSEPYHLRFVLRFVLLRPPWVSASPDCALLGPVTETAPLFFQSVSQSVLHGEGSCKPSASATTRVRAGGSRVSIQRAKNVLSDRPNFR